MAGAAAPLQRNSCRTLTKTSRPLRPSLLRTSSMVLVRATASPTRTGLRNSNWLPAHMRRGSGTGGKKPPRLAWPSAPISLCRCIGKKYSQCHSSGSAVPAGTSAAGWSSVALSATTGVGWMVSCSVSLRPTQARRSAGGAVVLVAVIGVSWAGRMPGGVMETAVCLRGGSR